MRKTSNLANLTPFPPASVLLKKNQCPLDRTCKRGFVGQSEGLSQGGLDFKQKCVNLTMGYGM